MIQKAKCLTRKIEKEELAEAACMKNVRRNIKIRCAGKMQGEKLSKNLNL